MRGSEGINEMQGFRRVLQQLRNEQGFSLPELLVALVLTGIVTAAIYQAMTAQQRIYVVQGHLSEMIQNLRGGSDIMAREIRMCGFDPRKTSGVGFDLATTGSLQFKTDRNGDGDLVNASPPPAHDSNEQIRYALTNDSNGDGIADSFPCHLGREVWNGGLQQVAENIEALNFVYLDENGAVLPTPVPAGDLPKIRIVEITLVARTEKKERDYMKSSEFRNQRGTLVLTAPGDGFRRQVLSITVHCRNMGL